MGYACITGELSTSKKSYYIRRTRWEKTCSLSIVWLFNLRARLVGINQVLSSYMLHLGPEANTSCTDSLPSLFFAIAITNISIRRICRSLPALRCSRSSALPASRCFHSCSRSVSRQERSALCFSLHIFSSCLSVSLCSFSSSLLVWFWIIWSL